MPRAYRIFPDAGYLYFITCTVINWIPLFITFDYSNLLLDSFTYCRTNKGLRLHAYVVMPNHFHAIVSSDIPSQLPSIIRDIKHFTSIALRSCLHADNARYLYSLLDPETDQRSAQSRSRRLWQPGYHGVAIYSQPFFRSKLDYLHENPVRKGFVDRAEHWRCSSARDYILNERGPIAIDLLEI